MTRTVLKGSIELMKINYLLRLQKKIGIGSLQILNSPKYVVCHGPERAALVPCARAVYVGILRKEERSGGGPSAPAPRGEAAGRRRGRSAGARGRAAKPVDQ